MGILVPLNPVKPFHQTKSWVGLNQGQADESHDLMEQLAEDMEVLLRTLTLRGLSFWVKAGRHYVNSVWFSHPLKGILQCIVHFFHFHSFKVENLICQMSNRNAEGSRVGIMPANYLRQRASANVDAASFKSWIPLRDRLFLPVLRCRKTATF